MAYPKFTDNAGSNSYVWEDWPDLPSERPDIASKVRVNNTTISHERNGVTFARQILTTTGAWEFNFKNITLSMVTSLKYFYELSTIRYFPDSDSGFYFTCFLNGDFSPVLKRGGTYDLKVSLQEI